jgi:uncharacterized protein
MNEPIPRPEFPSDFCGQARLFPLPNVVFFPHVAQPLLIFEPRYRAMLEEAILEDQLIGMALLTPGWETASTSAPPVEPIICLCHVVTHSQRPDGNYVVLLLGMRRARIEEELVEPNCAFRRARVSVLEDIYPEGDAAGREGLRDELKASFYRHLPNKEEVRNSFERVFTSYIPVGALADIIAFSIEFDVPFKQRVLSELNADQRARLVLDALPNAPRQRPFPPDFSEN